MSESEAPRGFVAAEATGAALRLEKTRKLVAAEVSFREGADAELGRCCRVALVLVLVLVSGLRAVPLCTTKYCIENAQIYRVYKISKAAAFKYLSHCRWGAGCNVA